MLRANGLQDPVNTYSLRCDGFASLGIRDDGISGTQTMPSRARLQLVDKDGSEEAPWRPYWRNGVLFTGNQDMGYVGHRYYEGDHEEPWNYTRGHSDLLISAGDSDLTDPLRQRIRFTYTTTPDAGATTGAATYDGLEFMQLWPERPDNGYVGIGDFTADGSDPTERLDVLNRTIRIQRLVPEYRNDTLSRVVMSDGNGRLHWRNATTLNLADCEWRMDPAPGPNHVYTATGAVDPDCPDSLEFVGIGTPSPIYKLDIWHKKGTSGSVGGLRNIYLGSTTGANTGITTEVSPQNTTNMEYGTGVASTVNSVSLGGTGVIGAVNLDYDAADSEDGQVAGVYGSVDASAGYFGTAYGTRGNVVVDGGTVDDVFGTHGSVVNHNPVNATYGMWGESWAQAQVGSNFGGYANAVWEGDGYTIGQSIGLRARSMKISGSATATKSYGLIAQGRDGSSETWGVNATASSSGTGTVNSGIYASGANGATNYGIYATATGPSGSTNWAAYLVGPSFTTANAWTPSDQNLKTNIDLIEDPLSQVMSLRPKRYTYETDAYPQLNLPTGEQYGFLAQEYAEVFPNMVRDVIQPAITDADGEQVSEEASFKAMSQANLLPLAIAAIQQQNARIDQLQEQLAACCSSDGGQRSSAPIAASNDLRTERLTIAPNPFTTSTTLRYFMAQEGRARLEVSAEDGRSIDVLREERTNAGEHTYEWNTSGLSSGSYFIAFIVDGNTIVKRAVKVNER
ncbi:MAG: tail fiber domain-containing protein [Flavobacteriales bacterium]|nr:tail fiber domain-containing protein [Flavobacteriales bacterium]